MSLEQEHFFENSSDFGKVTMHGGELYTIPQRCRYVSSDFCQINCLLQDGIRYNLIVMDPPWENKSAKRLKTYDYLRDADLLKTPIRPLAADGAIIALWLTNKARLQIFVETCLFPAWNVVKEAEWTWVKVTQSGEPVFPFHSRHKKPFEKLIFARFGERKSEKTIPDGLIIVSIPSAVHSHKPTLSDVLQPYLDGAENRSLELFARSLTSGWTSWGLEVLKLQNINLFETSD
jgi:N(6)-adenine-specific DNA methyltransferase